MPDTMTEAPAPNRYHSMTPRQLAEELALVDAANKANKVFASEVQAEIERRFAATIAARVAEAAVDTGTFSIGLLGDGIAKREIKKEVKYDSAKLLGVMSEMSWDQIKALFKIEVSVPEKVYGGLAANPELKAKIDAARTVTPRPQPIKLVFSDDTAAA
jgi:hypothetical protein